MLPRLFTKLADLKPEVQLQPHQQRIADMADEKPLRMMLVHSLGSGKSLSGLAAAEAQEGPFTVAAPASLRDNYRKEIGKFTDKKTPSDVVSYTALAQGKPVDKLHSLIFDECLPLGTLVDGRAIETIRPGDYVWSFNHSSLLLELARVSRTAQRLTETLVVIRFSDGGQITCTPNHPLYTYKGYVSAEDIVVGDHVYARKTINDAEEEEDPNDVSAVSATVRGDDVSVTCTSVLLQNLSQRSLGRQHEEGAQSTRRRDSHEDDYKQPYERFSDTCKGEQHAEEATAQTSCSRRERKGPDGPGDLTSFSAGVENRRSGGSGTRRLEARHASQLSSGRGEHGAESLHRSGRQFASRPGSSTSRRTQDGLLTVCRVESVSFYERGRDEEFERLCPGGVVCDLTVDDNHNFFAEGYLVHNSHNLRNPDSGRTQRAIELADKAKQVIMLSGTPIVNRPGDLAVPIRMLTGRQMSPQEFEKRYVGVKHIYPNLFRRMIGWSSGKELEVRREQELKDTLRGHVDYHDPGKPVVPTTYEDIPVQMSPEQERIYEAMWAKLPWHAKWKLRNEVSLSDEELQRMQAFLTGPRQVGLSTYPYLSTPDHDKAFNQSPKLQVAMQKVQELLKDPRAKALVFSNFIDAGLMPYQHALQKANIPSAVFHGGMTDMDRKKLVDDYNNNKLRVALLGPSGTEGLSFKGTQLVQLLDPYWNPVRPKQSVGRGLRYDSHFGLPEELQNVRVQRFLSRLPPGMWDRMLSRIGFDRTERTYATDDRLAAIAKRKEDLNRKFMELLREVGSEGKTQ